MPGYIGARRKDANHTQVLNAARDVGAEVLDLHQLPGALDALVGYRGKYYLVEIKDGAKTPGNRKLTEAEVEIIDRFRAVGCEVLVVISVEELLKGIGAVE